MIKVKVVDMREALEDAADRKVTPGELKRFIKWVEDDLYEWLRDNAKSYVRSGRLNSE